MIFITVKNGIITGTHCGTDSALAPTSPFYGSEIFEIPQEAHVQTGDTVDFYDEQWNRKSDTQLLQEKLITLPDDWILDSGHIRAMDESERIIAGIVPLPNGYKISAGEIVEMSIEEKIITGLLPTPEGYKIQDGKVIEMSLAEKIEAHLVTVPLGMKLVGENLVDMTDVEKISEGIMEMPIGMKIVDGNLVDMTIDEKFTAGVLSDNEYIAIKQAEVQQEINRRLALINTEENKAIAEIDSAFASEYKAALKKILSVKQQSGYPVNIDWSDIPDVITV